MRRSWVLGTALALGGISLNTGATPITWKFEGFTNGFGLPGGTCPVLGCQDILLDAPVTGFLTFDSHAPDLEPGDPFLGVYISSGEPFGISLDIGPYHAAWNTVRIAVAPDASSFPRYIMDAFDPAGAFPRMGLFECYERFSGNLPTDAQLLTPPPPNFGARCFDPSYIAAVGGANIKLTVTRYVTVPEPSTLTLLSAALVMLGLSLRRRLRDDPTRQ